MLSSYRDEIELYRKVLAQKSGDSNKIYSLHEPNVKCYAKGKINFEADFTITEEEFLGV